MKAAILGYGTVGSGVGEIIGSLCDKGIEVAHILERTENLHKHPLMCDDINVILNDEEVDVVVETMGGIEPAHTFIMAALNAKKHVVSANKAVIARYMEEFHACADANGVRFLYEASCGGGIPWLHNLYNALRIDEIDEIHGIFNGTTNYILDHMEKEQAQFDVILAKAQQLGYAESDPSADIDGIDIQNKLRISATIAFQGNVPLTFPVFGIRNINKTDIDYAASLHKKIKLPAIAKRVDDRYYAAVEPTLYEETQTEASISENFNLTCIHGATIGDLKFYGQGAGKLPTANAVVQDILDLHENIDTQPKNQNKALRVDTSLVCGTYIVRTDAPEALINELFTDFYVKKEVFKDNTYYWMEHISSYMMHQKVKELCNTDGNVFFAQIAEVNA